MQFYIIMGVLNKFNIKELLILCVNFPIIYRVAIFIVF